MVSTVSLIGDFFADEADEVSPEKDSDNCQSQTGIKEIPNLKALINV